MEFLQYWIPPVTTTALFAGGLWLARELISTRLKSSVQHEFNAKLEGLRSEFRSTEERLKAELKEREAEIGALRGGALTALASRQSAIDKRKLEAVDQLWASFTSFASARGLAASMSAVNFDEAVKLAPRDPNARRLFEIMGSGFDQTKIDHQQAEKARPYVSPMAWAIYSAYRAILMHDVMRWHVLKSGFKGGEITDRKVIDKLIVAALPHLSDYVEKYGPDGYYLVLESLEDKLLSELQSMMSGKDSDRASVVGAAEIIRQARAVQESTEATERTVDS